MRKKLIGTVLPLLMGVVLVLSPFFSFVSMAIAANPTVTISQINKNSADEGRITTLCDEINSDVEEIMAFNKLLTSSRNGNDLTITMHMSDYLVLNQEEKQKVMSMCLSDIQNSNVSVANRNKIYNFVADSDSAVSSLVRQLSTDVTADFANAYSYFKPFSSPLGIFLGCMSIAIFVMLGLTIVFDIAYLTVPLFQWALTRTNESAKPGLISLEAWDAMKEMESKAGVSGKRTPLGVYFKLKVKEYIALGVCMLYLFSGQIYALIAWFIDSFQGLLPK